MDQVDFNAPIPWEPPPSVLSATEESFLEPILEPALGLALRHSDVEGISRLTTVVPGTNESNSKLMQKLYKLVDLHKRMYWNRIRKRPGSKNEDDIAAAQAVGYEKSRLA
ncbi:hypothetical protein RYX36_010810 [Vicia faba]